MSVAIGETNRKIHNYFEGNYCVIGRIIWSTQLQKKVLPE